MLAEANAAVPRLRAAEVRDTIGRGNALIVDVRDTPELAASGKLTGAVHPSAARWNFADPETPYYNPAFAKEKTVILSWGSGGRAFAGKTPCAAGQPQAREKDNRKGVSK